MDDLCKDRNHDGLRELAQGSRLGAVVEHVGIFDGPKEWMGQDVALVAIHARDAHHDEQEEHAALQARCFEGFPSASDGIFDHVADVDAAIRSVLEAFESEPQVYRDMVEPLRAFLAKVAQ